MPHYGKASKIRQFCWLIFLLSLASLTSTVRLWQGNVVTTASVSNTPKNTTRGHNNAYGTHVSSGYTPAHLQQSTTAPNSKHALSEPEIYQNIHHEQDQTPPPSPPPKLAQEESPITNNKQTVVHTKPLSSSSFAFGTGVANRYSQHNPFRKPLQYAPTGGKLPYDDGDNLEDFKRWKFVDNTTCRRNSLSDDGSLWQHRAPYALLLGVMKGGTHALIEALWEHQLVARTGHWELHFYNSRKRVIRSDRGIDRDRTLANYGQLFLQALNHSNSTLPVSSDKSIQDWLDPTKTKMPMVAIDSTPKYFQQSDRIPELIFCVTPWVKLMVLLRDPMARLESQYRYMDESRKASDRPMIDWATWIQDDLRLLNETGVLSAQTLEEERLAWKTYQRRPNSHQIVGRGLYIIPLLQYWDALKDAGQSTSNLYIVQSEAFHDAATRQDEYAALLNFLELPPHVLQNRHDDVHATTKTSTIPLPPPLRRQLMALYQPYNDRLYEALGWEKVWG